MGKLKCLLSNFVFFVIPLIFLTSCGLDTYIVVDSPTNVINPPSYTTEDYNNECFEFWTNDSGVASPTVYSLFLNTILVPALFALDKNLMLLKFISNSSQIFVISRPTTPVAPNIAIFGLFIFLSSPKAVVTLCFPVRI